MTEREYSDLSLIQRSFIETLTDEKVIRLTEVADLFRELPDEAKDFLRGAKPGTLNFLKDLRDDEIKELGNAIENARAFRRGGRLLRWGVVTLFGTFVGMSVLWDKLTAWLKVAR